MSEIDYRAIRRRVILRWLNRLLFVVNALFFYYMATILDFDIDYNRTGIVMWSLILLAHFLWAFGILSAFIQRQADREAERLRARGYTVIAPERDRTLADEEKPKRAARLSDDGEIEYEDDDEAYSDVPVRRSRAHE